MRTKARSFASRRRSKIARKSRENIEGDGLEDQGGGEGRAQGSVLRGNCYQQIGLNLLTGRRVMATYTPICYQVATRKLTELLPKIDASRAYLMKIQANKQRIW